MLLKDLVEAEEIEEAQGDMDQVVTGLAYDSREVTQGNVFFAIPGARVDGHDFALHALERRAAAVVLERRVALPESSAWVRVRNVRRTMGIWAAIFFSHPSRRLRLVGITGTNGKTTTTYLLESIFAAAGMIPGVIGTINYRYQGRIFSAPHTTPESIDLQALMAGMVRAGVQSVAIEVSSHALTMERVRGMELDGALFTNLSRDHLDYHGDMENYFSVKSSLFTDYLWASRKRNKFAVIHGGDSRGSELLGTARRLGFEVFSYGQSHEWDVHPLEIDGNLEGLRGTIRVKDHDLRFTSRLVGAPNLENILGAVGVAFALGLPDRAISEGIARLESVPGRMEMIPNSFGFSVLVDYAHTPDALERVLRAVRPLTRGKLIVVFGCGGDRDRGKRPLMGEIAARLSDLVVVTSDNPRTEEPLKILEEIENGVRRTGINKLQIADLICQNSKLETRNSEPASERGYCLEPDRRAALRLALRRAQAEDLVLIAGKGHEDYQIFGTKRIHFDDREVVREELAVSASY